MSIVCIYLLTYPIYLVVSPCNMLTLCCLTIWSRKGNYPRCWFCLPTPWTC